MILYFLIAIAIVAADLLSKWLVVTNIPLGSSVTLIPGVLNFTYVQNRGAAFGSLANQRYVFIILSLAMIAFLIFFLIKGKGYSKIVYLCASFVLGGGIGNMVDRISLGYVVDFVDFCAFPFWKWIFNLADSFICIGVFLVALYLVFFDSKAVSKGYKSLIFEDKKVKKEKIALKDNDNEQ